MHECDSECNLRHNSSVLFMCQIVLIVNIVNEIQALILDTEHIACKCQYIIQWRYIRGTCGFTSGSDGFRSSKIYNEVDQAGLGVIRYGGLGCRINNDIPIDNLFFFFF